MNRFLALSLWLTLLFAAQPVMSGIYTWKGGTPGDAQNWQNPLNWTPTNHPPINGDTVIINNGTVTLNTDLELNGSTITGSTINGSGSLTIDNASSVAYTTFFIGVTNNGQMDISVVSTIDNTTTASGPFVNAGSSTITMHGNASFSPAGKATVNHGEWTLESNTSISLPTGGGVAFINAADGFINLSNATITGQSGATALQNNGEIDVFQTSSYSTGLQNNGSIAVASNQVLNINPPSMVTLGNESLFEGEGLTWINVPVSLTGQSFIYGNVQFGTDGANSATTFTINGTLLVKDGGVLNWYSGIFGGVGTNITGSLEISTQGVLNMFNDQNSLALNNLLLTNNGTVIWTNNGGFHLANSAQVLNAGQFLINGNSIMAPTPNDTSPVAFQNLSHGEVIMDHGPTNASDTIELSFYDSGKVTVKVGTLTFIAGGSINDWEVESNATIRLLQGTYASQASALIVNINDGSILLNGATVNIPASATLAIRGSFTFNSGTFTGMGTLQLGDISAGGYFQWNAGNIYITNSNYAVEVGFDSSMVLYGTTAKGLANGAIANGGQLLWQGGDLYMGNNARIVNYGVFQTTCNNSLIDNSTASNSAPVFTNAMNGIFTKSSSGSTTTIDMLFVNQGEVDADSGIIEFLQFFDGGLLGVLPKIVMGSGQIQLDTPTVMHEDISGSGTINAKKGLELSGGELTVVVIIFEGNITNDEVFDLESFFGNLTIEFGNFSQTANGSIIVPVQSSSASGGYGKLTAGNNVNLGGTVQVVLTNGYAAPIGLSLPFLTSSGLSGTFGKVIAPPGMGVSYTNNGVNIVVTNKVPVIIGKPILVGGQFQFSFNTISNRVYNVQYTTNLASTNWLPFTNFTATSSNVTVNWPGTSTNRVFFRVAEP